MAPVDAWDLQSLLYALAPRPSEVDDVNRTVHVNRTEWDLDVGCLYSINSLDPLKPGPGIVTCSYKSSITT